MVENAQLLQAVTELIGRGKQDEAIARVTEAAEQGDDWAALCLAEWKLTGQGIARDPAGAVELLEAAAGRGADAAALRLVTLYASGTGCEPDYARALALAERLEQHGGLIAAQCVFLRQHAGEPGPDGEELSGDPRVVLLRGALLREECAWIRALAEPRLEPSFVEEPGTGRRIPHPVRTSDGASFGPLHEDLVVNRINRRIARLSGTEYEWGEPLHVLRYAPQQQYRPHVDALPGVANQRQWTAIAYCNAGYEGGETHFPRLDLTVRGEEGDLLLFANTDGDGGSDKRSEHAGLPVSAGTKWIATRWIRQRRYHPWEPETAR